VIAFKNLAGRATGVAPVLPLLLAAFAFLHRAREVAGSVGFPLDDTWIHLRLAANLASGHGFAINPGEPVACSTAPLWTVILAGLATLRPPGVATALIPSLLLSLAATLILYRLLRRGHGTPIALAGAALFGLLPSVVWSAVSGLEVPLFFVLETAGFLALDHPRPRTRFIGLMFLALACQVRPEGALLFGFGFLLYVIDSWPDMPGRRARIALVLAPIVASAAIAAPYALFCLETTGRPLPTTFYAKTTGLFAAVPSWVYLKFAYGLVAKENLVLAGLVAVGAAAVFRACALGSSTVRGVEIVALAWTLALPLAYAAMGKTLLFAGGAGNFGRYLYVLLPAWVILAARGAGTLIGAAEQAGRRFGGPPLVERAGAALLLLAAFAAQVQPLAARARLYAVNVRNIAEMQVAAGRWLRDHVPSGATVAVNDLGAIAFFSNLRVLDLVGIGTPAVLDEIAAEDAAREATGGEASDPLHEVAVARFLYGARPPFLAVFPDWYPRFLAELEARGALRTLHWIRIEDNRTCGSDLLVVFAVTWP